MSAITHIRKNLLGASQADIAAIAGTSQATVSRWEKGELIPDIRQIGLIRDAIISRGIPWDDRLFFEALPAAKGAPPAPASCPEAAE